MSFEKVKARAEMNSDQRSENSRITTEAQERAAEAVEKLSSYFHPIETGDPRVFLAGAVELFSRYPQEVINKALDVSIGLPGKHKWWPRISEMREVLDDLHWPIKFKNQWDKRAREQIAQRPALALEDHRSSKPSAPMPALDWQPSFGISKEAWDSIPNQPETFTKLPVPTKV